MHLKIYLNKSVIWKKICLMAANFPAVTYAPCVTPIDYSANHWIPCVFQPTALEHITKWFFSV